MCFKNVHKKNLIIPSCDNRALEKDIINRHTEYYLAPIPDRQDLNDYPLLFGIQPVPHS